MKKRIKFTLNDSRNRLLFLGGLILLMFIAVAGRLLWIQIISGTELTAYAPGADRGPERGRTGGQHHGAFPVCESR